MSDPSGTNLPEFQRKLDEFAAQVRQQALELHRGVVREVFGGLVLANPVGNPSQWKHKPRKGYVGGTSRRGVHRRHGYPLTKRTAVAVAKLAGRN